MDLGPNTRLSNFIIHDYQANEEAESEAGGNFKFPPPLGERVSISGPTGKDFDFPLSSERTQWMTHQNPFRMSFEWPDPIVVHQNDRRLNSRLNFPVSTEKMKNWLYEIYGKVNDFCYEYFNDFWNFYINFFNQSLNKNLLTYDKCWECGRTLAKNTHESSHSWRRKYCAQCWELYRQDLVNEICSQIFLNE